MFERFDIRHTLHRGSRARQRAAAHVRDDSGMARLQAQRRTLTKCVTIGQTSLDVSRCVAIDKDGALGTRLVLERGGFFEHLVENRLEDKPGTTPAALTAFALINDASGIGEPQVAQSTQIG